jgi:hypothetical protein
LVRLVDSDAYNKVESDRQIKLKGLVLAVVDLYWRLCYDIFQFPPSTIFEQNAVAVAKRLQVVKPKVLSAKSDVVFKAPAKPEPVAVVPEKAAKPEKVKVPKIQKPIFKGPKKQTVKA